MAQQIQLRRGTAAQWLSVNPILASGEMGVETDTHQFKIGDGSLAWTALPYGGTSGAGVPTGGTANQALVKIDGIDYHTQWSTIDKTFVGLGAVDNTSDINKPVSTAQAAADSAVQAYSIQRANHTGTQLASTISDFVEAAQDAVGLSFANTPTITFSYDDPSSQFSAVVNDASLTDAKISTTASIQTSKLAPLSASKALVSDVTGHIVPSATTSDQIGYLSAVTSDVQAQINSKQAAGNYITAMTGDVTASGPGSSAATISSGAVDNSKVSATAAIAYSKLSLGSSIVNSDVSPTAAVAYSKLNLANSILDADINASANIAISKIGNTSALSELYGFPQVGDLLMTAISRLAWSNGLQYDIIAADASILSGFTWMRDTTSLADGITLTINSGATLRLI